MAITSGPPRASPPPPRPSCDGEAGPNRWSAVVSAATTDTARRYSPTCVVNHRRARWVTEPRGAAIRASLVVHDPRAHTLLGQDGEACARPPPPDARTPAKSVRRTTGGCLTQPRVPQPGQSCCQSGGHSTCTTSAGINPEHDDIWQAHRQLTHSGRDGLHRGPPGPGILVETDTGKTPVPHPPTTHPRPANTSPTRRLPPSPKHHMTPTAVRAVAAAAQALDLGTTVGHGYNRWT